MNINHIYEFLGDPDKFPGFLQTGFKEPSDENSWKEHIGIQCGEKGSEPFGVGYVPVLLEFNNEGRRKKNVVGDICLSMHPFVIFSDKARETLDAFLSPAGEFLEVAAPVPGFVGYRVLKHLDGCIDMENSTYTNYDNGGILIRKPTMYETKVHGHDIFAVSTTIAGLFVSEAFKNAVLAAKLKGFSFSREVPLTLANKSS
jgi:hypothetical protein